MSKRQRIATELSSETDGKKSNSNQTTVCRESPHTKADQTVERSIRNCKKLLMRGWEAWWTLLLEINAIHQLLSSLNRLKEFPAFLARIPLSRGHAYAMLKVLARFADYELANRFTPTALIKLAPCPDMIIAEAKRLVEDDGVFMTAERASELIAEQTTDSRQPKAVKIARAGFPTIVLHPVKQSSQETLARLQQAIQALLDRFTNSNGEEQ